MSSRIIVSIEEVIDLLERCAPGYRIRMTQHHHCVMYNGRTYPTLPLGRHGASRSKGRGEIKNGHVKSMIRELGIDPACAGKNLPKLKLD